MITVTTLSALSALSGLASPSPTLLIALTVAGWVTGVIFVSACIGLWVMSCRAYPYTSCPKCDALGRVKHPSGKYWRPCPHCGGEGQRLRPGARLFGTSHNRSKGKGRNR